MNQKKFRILGRRVLASAWFAMMVSITMMALKA
jgi:hypothetical protein